MRQINLEGKLCLNDSPLPETCVTHLQGIPRFTHLNSKALVLWECQEVVAAEKGDHLEAREDLVFSSFLKSKPIILNNWLAL